MARTVKRCDMLNPTLATDSTSPVIDIEKYNSGNIAIPSGSTITTLTYFVAIQTSGATPTNVLYAAYDATPTAITQTVAAGKSYPIPAALFGCGQIVIEANAAGAVWIQLKS